MSEDLERLLAHPAIRRGRQAGVGETNIAVPSGHSALDAELPGGGWPAQGLTEILLEHWGIGELGLLMPGLLAAQRNAAGWLAWIAPPCIPYAPALAAEGLDLTRLLLVHPRSPRDALWAAEQALRCGTCAAVLLWLQAATDRDLRRLQLAAEEGRGWGVLFRPCRARRQASPAALRLALAPAEAGLGIDIFKSRGGRPASVLLKGNREGRAASAGTPDTAGPPALFS